MKTHSNSVSTLILLTVSYMLTVSGIHAQSSNDGNENGGVKKSTLLKGGVEHSERLPALPQSYSVGASFDASKLRSLPSGEQWYKIPGWAAGEWKQQASTTFYKKDLTTGETDYSTYTIKFILPSSHGRIRDRHGDIWDCNSAGHNLGRTDDEDVYEIIDIAEPLAVSDTALRIRYVAKIVEVVRASNQISNASQEECIATFNPAGDGIMKVTSSIRNFDDKGAPIREGKILCYDLRTSAYKDAPSQNVRTRFKNFLIANNLSRLIP